MSSMPSKKRKAYDDGRATDGDVCTNNNNYTNAGGGFLSSWLSYFPRRREVPSCGDNLSQKMDKMMQIMEGMQEKLISVESRCEQLEVKCNSVENKLTAHVDSKMDSLHAKIDKTMKHQEYNDMLVRNQNWNYSALIHPIEYWMHNGAYQLEEAEYIFQTSEYLKSLTKTIRRGEFTTENEEKGIDFELDPDAPIFDASVNHRLHPHWTEFAEALKQFNPVLGVLPDDRENFFGMHHAQLSLGAMNLLKDALMETHFKGLFFTQDRHRRYGPGGMSIDNIFDIVDNNKHLRELDIHGYFVANIQITKICTSVHRHPSLFDLSLNSCFEDGLGDEMLDSLLTSSEFKLQRLAIRFNGITSRGITLLSEFLATDPPLKWLEIDGNDLGDNEAESLANALRRNTTLRRLDLSSNDITDVGKESLRLALHDDRSLNSVSDSNHSCYIVGVALYWNKSPAWCTIRTWDMDDLRKKTEMNRAQKFYGILYCRNGPMTNVRHFNGIDIKILPNMIGTVQRYWNSYLPLNSLSIVYEVMRKWEKVFPLYNLEGGNTDDT